MVPVFKHIPIATSIGVDAKRYKSKRLDHCKVSTATTNQSKPWYSGRVLCQVWPNKIAVGIDCRNDKCCRRSSQ